MREEDPSKNRKQTFLVSWILSLHHANVAKNWTGLEESTSRPLTWSVEPIGCLASRDPPAASWNNQSVTAQCLKAQPLSLTRPRVAAFNSK